MTLLQLFLVLLGCLQCSRGNRDPRLKLSGSNGELRGCYTHNLHLKLCFELGPDFMQLSSTNGTVLVDVRASRGGQTSIQIRDSRFIHRYVELLPWNALILCVSRFCASSGAHSAYLRVLCVKYILSYFGLCWDDS